MDLSHRPTSDEIDGLARECEATDGETQIALRGGDRYVARLIETGRDSEPRDRGLVAAGDSPFGIRV